MPAPGWELGGAWGCLACLARPGRWPGGARRARWNGAPCTHESAIICAETVLSCVELSALFHAATAGGPGVTWRARTDFHHFIFSFTQNFTVHRDTQEAFGGLEVITKSK